MRFKCANRISIFLRSWRDCSKPSVPANDRATSRACSWMSRGILRDGSFGQHCGLSGQTSQSSLLARYRSVLPSCTVPLVPSRFPPGQCRRRRSGHIESRCARRCHHPASTCRTRGYVARCLSPRPASSASEPPHKQYLRQAALASHPSVESRGKWIGLWIYIPVSST
jgi:hypothetical protein